MIDLENFIVKRPGLGKFVARDCLVFGKIAYKALKIVAYSWPIHRTCGLSHYFKCVCRRKVLHFRYGKWPHTCEWFELVSCLVSSLWPDKTVVLCQRLRPFQVPDVSTLCDWDVKNL